MANSAFNHSPSIVVPGSSTNTALIRWSGTGADTFLDSTIIVGATTMGLAVDTNLLTFADGTLTIGGTLSATLIAGAAVKDEDNMASNSATHLASQQSIKAYADTKSPIDGATLTGTTQFATLSDGTIAVTAWADEDNMASNSATLIPTQQSVKAYVDAAGGGTTVTGTVDNAILTFINSNSEFTAESGLTFDGRTLTLSGDGGGYSAFYLTQTSTTSGRKAFMRLRTESSAGGAADPEISFETNGGTSWQVGIDNSQSDRFVIANQGDIGTYDKLRLNTGAAGSDVTVVSGNLVIGTAGKGIDFSAASGSASGSTNALLDDYEEGTFTPILDAMWPHTSGGMTHSTQFGHYTKIGNRVHINLRVVTTATGDVSGGSTAMAIRGLPFVCDNTGNSETGLIVGYSAGLSMTAAHTFVATTDANGNAKVNFRQNSDGEGFRQNVTRDNITTTCTINVSGMYEVDS